MQDRIEKYEKIFSLLRKIILLVTICASILALAITMFNAFGLWDKFKDITVVQQWIESAGAYAILVYAAIVLAQVIVLPIPSTVTNLVAAVLFDPWITFLVTTVCTVAGSYVCFWLGRAFGKRIVTWLVGEEKTEQYGRVLNEKGRLFFVLMLLLPCFPDDILCMVAGLSTMGWGFFSLAVILARPVMIAVISFVGRAAMDALDTWGLPVSIGIFLLIMVAVILVMLRRDKKSDKNEENKKEIK